MPKSLYWYLCSHDHFEDEGDGLEEQPIQYIVHMDYKARQHIKPINYYFY